VRQVCGTRLVDMTSQELSTILNAIVRLQPAYLPPASFLHAFTEAATLRMPGFNNQVPNTTRTAIDESS
jgi:hypothetical protein